MSGRRRAVLGFTLLELLIAMAVLSFLGTAVVVVLRGGIKTWRRGEARRESFELAQAVLGQLADDLGNATVDPETTGRDGHPVEVIFLGDTDGANRSRLALVRTIRGESENTITGTAGSEVGGDERIKYNNDYKHALEGRLKATGGLMEVAYCMGTLGTPDGEVLFRGIRSPIGGRTSFFAGEKNFVRAPLPGTAGKAPVAGMAYCRAFASRVMFFELLYATPWTNTWAKDVPARRTTTKGSESGPINYWDSTRGILKPPSNDAKVFTTFIDQTSYANPQDDILPPRVKVTLVLRENDWADSSTYLEKDLSASATDMLVTEPARLNKEGGFIHLSEKQYLKGGDSSYVNGEWVQYDDVQGNKAHIVARGARSTKAQAHPAFTEAAIGRTFEAVIAIPAAREDWSGR